MTAPTREEIAVAMLHGLSDYEISNTETREVVDNPTIRKLRAQKAALAAALRNLLLDAREGWQWEPDSFDQAPSVIAAKAALAADEEQL